MNKLRKKEPQVTQNLQRPVLYAAPSAYSRLSQAEQYWAARALAAETLLVARASNREELQRLSHNEDLKRSREVAAAITAGELRYEKLERIVYLLLGTLVSIVFFLVYRLSHPPEAKPPPKWSRPSHFTIPILSPFASVVEHQMSVVGFRTIAIIVVVLGILAYGVFRNWMSNMKAR